MQEITIRIGKGGKVNLDVLGVKGSSCKDLTKGIEKALGNTVDTKSTDEYYQQEQQNGNFQNLGGGQNW